MDGSTSGDTERNEAPADQWYIEEMLAQYRADPSSVDQSWRDYFETTTGAAGTTPSPAPVPRTDPLPVT
ncbi:MAG: hypothetical protein L0J79_02625, partial [Propionibacterium sp.]|nr:hypothetical protein [Propionibacterium sp.]